MSIKLPVATLIGLVILATLIVGWYLGQNFARDEIMLDCVHHASFRYDEHTVMYCRAEE